MYAHNITLDILSFSSSPVKSGLYALLGTFAEVFPEHMIRMSDRLVSIYTSVLKSEVHFFWLKVLWLSQGYSYHSSEI